MKDRRVYRRLGTDCRLRQRKGPTEEWNRGDHFSGHSLGRHESLIKEASPMRVARWLVLGWSALTMGCGSIVTYTTMNVIVQPIQRFDDHIISGRNCRLANLAWAELQKNRPQDPYSVDYGRGFRTGFADFLDAGGSGEPPAIPPWRYRLYKYQTPSGERAIEDWYAGFRDGAAQAQASGYRRFVIVRPSMAAVGAVAAQSAGRHQSTASQPAAEAPPLPMPRTLPPVPPPPDDSGELEPKNP
jgi:hypothetical protein